ncbi:sulfur carrier protein ThiS [Fictibacillus phosphorivorans]|uniref:sulfur carrier protein ThiS n=1 Tax=Fictibacillus phosphorivorans TaxID=1221500 RepID=UPI00203AC634|nr:sulfur carrier protein ThiS [Fictibacillus phosphorivorans]MCM3718331.1 sulfur carrier protein ThiS [Fictibacillus phosphorivorans]MCM3775955.1 sulfur carrier protein ThiS [Fictibacillus phosphorivorans]
MKLKINGDVVQVPDTLKSVKELLEHLKLNDQIVIAEVNEEILQTEEQSMTQIKENDKIELVRFVGGG